MKAHRPSRAVLLTHPIALGALALWIANDQVLKAAWPGIVTGKLSDVAGMIVAPLALHVVLAVVFPRGKHLAWIAFGIVGLSFALTKTWLPANEAFTSILAWLRAPARIVLQSVYGGEWRERIVLVRDPSDLIAVPFGLLAVLIARRPTPTGQPDHQLFERTRSVI